MDTGRTRFKIEQTYITTWLVVKWSKHVKTPMKALEACQSGLHSTKGDVFYLHSRLLERAAKMNEAASDRGDRGLTGCTVGETGHAHRSEDPHLERPATRLP